MTITSRNVRGDEHLPECEMSGPQCAGRASGEGRRGAMFCLHCHRRCICGPLRTCEQRVQQIWPLTAASDQYAEGYGAALDAAREAAAAMWQYNGEQSNSLMIGYNRVLETIDALRGNNE